MPASHPAGRRNGIGHAIRRRDVTTWGWPQYSRCYFGGQQYIYIFFITPIGSKTIKSKTQDTYILNLSVPAYMSIKHTQTHRTMVKEKE